MSHTNRLVFLAALLALAAWPVSVAGRGGSTPGHGPPPEVPPSYIPHFEGRTIRGELCETGEPLSIVLRLDVGSGQVPKNPRFKTLFEPGDLKITITQVNPEPAGNPATPGISGANGRPVAEFDPVQVAFDAYRKTHPHARLLPTPADAWIDDPPQPAYVAMDWPPERTAIPIKALVADGDDPAAPRTEITCADLRDGFAQPGRYTVSVTYAGVTPPRTTPLAPGSSGMQVYTPGEWLPLELKLHPMSVSRGAAAQIMEAQARSALHVDAVKAATSIRVVDRGDQAGQHYDATYDAADGRTASIRLLGTEQTVPTISINGDPPHEMRSNGQPATLTLHVKDASLKSVLEDIRRQTGVVIAYNSGNARGGKRLVPCQ